jgi:hypothetical protein
MMPQAVHYIDPENPIDKHVCPHCAQTFTQNWTLTRHLREKICIEPRMTKKELMQFKFEQDLRDKITQENLVKEMSSKETLKELIKESAKDMVKELKDQLIGQIGGQPSLTNNQNLSIVCVGSNDNLLDILTASEGLPKALTFVKSCALARLAGDCRILESVYKLDTSQAAIMYVNKSKTKFVYYDERQRRTVESNIAVMAKKLVGILQRSYLKGMQSFQTDILGNDKDPDLSISQQIRDQLPKLDPYDIQIWNSHVHDLADEKYQKKILKSLKIPVEVRE